MAEETVEQYHARITAEYSQYTANQDIFHNGALAYVAGQAVPASNVALYSYDKNKQVDRVASKSEAQAAAGATEKGK